MAESAVSSALGRLNILFLERANSDVMRNQIQSLVKDLEEIQLNLKHVLARRDKSSELSGWVKNVEDLAYRIDDAIDILSSGSRTKRFKLRMNRFSQQLTAGGSGSRTKRFKLQMNRSALTSFLPRGMLGVLVKLLRLPPPSPPPTLIQILPFAIHDTVVPASFLRELQEMKNNMPCLPAEVSPLDLNDEENEKQSWLRRTYADSDSDEVLFGMDVDRERLVPCLLDDPKHGQVISICGIGGSGKTALARMLYKDTRVQHYFQCLAWVCVTEKFQRADVWRSIARDLSIEQRAEIVDSDEMYLRDELYFVLKEKRCLVVLDDIWSMDAWESLSIIFPFGEMNGKVILTTRIREIAEMVSEKRFIHLMTRLTDEESWEFFKMKAMPTKEPDFVADIEMMGKEMVKKCAGLPLAIVVLGGIMRKKHRGDEWMMVYQKIKAYINEGKQYSETAIYDVVNLSYDNLPYYLKPCFLYLGLFLGGSYIDAEKLYLLWVAEGLILSKKYGLEETNIDVAERYLGELALQGLVEVQEGEVPMFRRFKSCRLDDLMLDKCLLKGKEENFLEINNHGSKNEQARDSISSNNTTRRVAIHKHEDGDVSGGIKMDKHLRCLLQLNVKNIGELLPVQISNLAGLESLRILDFEGFDFRQTGLPRGLEKLVRLRYLSFKSCLLVELPSAIGKLCSLQIFDLRVRNLIKLKIPNVLSKLINLMHLFLPESFCTLHGGKLQLDRLTLLETLENFDTRICSIGDLLKLKQLRCLTTTVEGSIEDLQGIISRMTITTGCILHASLDIRNFDCYTDENSSLFGQLLKCRALFILRMQGKLEHLLPSNEISPCLMEVNLDGSELEEDPFATLENLPSLRVVVLRNDAFVGEKMVCSASGFRELKRLELSNLNFLEKWQVGDGAMPQLKSLTIEKCKKFDTVPDDFGFVNSVQSLNIREMPPSFEDGLRKSRRQIGGVVQTEISDRE